MHPTRRAALAGLAGLCTLAAHGDDDPPLPAPVSLADALAAALAKSEPLVVMASLQGCPYCRLVRTHYLVHELRRGLPVVQVDFREARAVRDFDGTPSTHAALLKTWKVEAAPTLLFFGRGAREVAERLVGVPTPDFYGAYLEERLRAARAALRS